MKQNTRQLMGLSLLAGGIIIFFLPFSIFYNYQQATFHIDANWIGDKVYTTISMEDFTAKGPQNLMTKYQSRMPIFVAIVQGEYEDINTRWQPRTAFVPDMVQFVGNEEVNFSCKYYDSKTIKKVVPNCSISQENNHYKLTCTLPELSYTVPVEDNPDKKTYICVISAPSWISRWPECKMVARLYSLEPDSLNIHPWYGRCEEIPYTEGGDTGQGGTDLNVVNNPPEDDNILPEPVRGTAWDLGFTGRQLISIIFIISGALLLLL